MQTGLILDSSITASSSLSSSKGPEAGRLHRIGDTDAKAWKAKFEDAYQWLQVDFGNWTRVTGVAVQSREYLKQWVASYSLTTSSTGELFEYVRNKTGAKKCSFLLVVRQVAPIAYKHRRKELFSEGGGPGSKFGYRTPYQNGFVFHLNPINSESTKSMLQILYFRPKLNVYSERRIRIMRKT